MNIGLEAKLVNTQKISIEAIKDISISYTSDSVHLYKTDEGEITLKEYMSYEPEPEELANITIGDDKIIIKAGERRTKLVVFGTYNRRIEIYIPASYEHDLETLTSSGSIKTDDSFKFSNFKASSRSGSIKLKDISADNINLSASSGSIRIENADGNRTFETSSGSIKVLGGCGDSILSSSSGSITIDNITGKLKAKASSGSIKVSADKLTSDIDINVSSGSAVLSVPKNSSFNFYAATSSGSIKTYFDDKLSYNKKGNQAAGSIGDNPAVSINISASSGSVRIM